MRLPVKFTFTLCWSTWFPPRQVPEPQCWAGPLTCAAVVKLQRALDAEGLLTGATAVPVLAVDLMGGGGGAVVGQLGHPLLKGAAPAMSCLTLPPCYPPAQLRNTNRAWLTHRPGKRSIQVTSVSTSASGSSPIRSSTLPGPGLSRPLRLPLPTPLARDSPVIIALLFSTTHLVPAVLVRNVLLQALLAAEQLGTFLTFKQLVT